MMNEKKHGIGHNIRQAVLVTVVLLVLCGLVFPVLLSGLSAVIFPSQAKGSLVTADGIAVGAKNVGQDFTEDYFMWCRPSAYNYNTYYEEDTDGDGQVEQYYNDGSEFAGLSSGSNNYAPSVKNLAGGMGIVSSLAAQTAPPPPPGGGGWRRTSRNSWRRIPVSAGRISPLT